MRNTKIEELLSAVPPFGVAPGEGVQPSKSLRKN
jgi:hypothetical protein